LIWEDGIVLGALILLTLTQPHHDSIRIVTLFLIFHSALVTVTFWPTGAGTLGYLAAFGLGLAVRLWPRAWPCFVVAASAYLVVYEGLWQSLTRFPWRLEWSLADLFNQKALSEKLAGPYLGWPYDRLLRDVKAAERFRIGQMDAILLSMLIGWWESCLLSLSPDPRLKETMGLAFLMGSLGLVGLVVPFSRLQIYTNFYPSSISIWGRIRTGRWIIPGYDRCFVGPLLSFLAMPAVFGSCLAAGIPVDISLLATITAVMGLALITPPGLKQWRSTGKHRMVAGQISQIGNAEVVKVG
jgi:hypothetical protein